MDWTPTPSAARPLTPLPPLPLLPLFLHGSPPLPCPKPRSLLLGAATLSSPAPGYVAGRLATEAVESLALALERVDNGGDGLPLGVLGVGDSVADHVLQEDLQDAAGLLVDQAGDPLDTAPPGLVA